RTRSCCKPKCIPPPRGRSGATQSPRGSTTCATTAPSCTSRRPRLRPRASCSRAGGAMTSLLVLRWVHLLAAATWTGGLIVLAALVVALRRAGAERALLQATARQFGRVSWIAMAVALATGVAQVQLLG